MFGYVRPDRPELKVREYNVFRAHYCGLCVALGQAWGTRARLTVSYEGTFLALLLSSLGPGEVRYRQARCPLPPWRRVPLAVAPQAQGYAADLNLLLAYHKLTDGWRDGDVPLARLGELILRAPARKAESRWPRQAALVRSSLEALRGVEQGRCSCLDEAAEPFARLLAEVAAGPDRWLYPGRLAFTKDVREGLRFLGYNLGKWIYTADAMADFEDDLRAGRYNPVLVAFGSREQARERVRFLLQHCLANMASALEVLPLGDNRGLLENIVYLGLADQTEVVLADERGGNRRAGSLRGVGTKARCQRGGDQEGVPRTGEEVPSGSLPG